MCGGKCAGATGAGLIIAGKTRHYGLIGVGTGMSFAYRMQKRQDETDALKTARCQLDADEEEKWLRLTAKAYARQASD